MAQLYKRPPITEAVIEIRLGAPVSMELVERVRDKLIEEYPLPVQKVMVVNFALGPGIQRSSNRCMAIGSRHPMAQAW